MTAGAFDQEIKYLRSSMQFILWAEDCFYDTKLICAFWDPKRRG